MSKKLLLLLIIISFLAFFQLGDHPFQDWDEARHGINAVEMLQNGDWVNLHFKGHPDDWNVKPPLTIWAIASSFSIFGVNEWALRLPSALSIIIAFFFLYQIIRLYRTDDFAFFTCLILASVKGWIGYHIGRTGDTDAMLLACLMGGSYFLFQFFHRQRDVNIILAALFFGLAFMTKGFAMTVYVPSIFLFAYFNHQLKFLLTQKVTYFSLFIFLLFPIGWFGVNAHYGVVFLKNNYNNAFTSMIFHDLIERFSNPNFINSQDLPSKLFIFSYLDTRFNIWNYFFYLGCLLSLFYIFQKKINLHQILSKLREPLVLISICWSIPLILFQNFATVQHHWYLAPALPFIAILTYEVITWVKKLFPLFNYVFWVALCFTSVQQIIILNSPDQKPLIITSNQDALQNASKVYNLVPNLSQSLTLYLYQQNPHQIFIKNPTDFNEKMAKNDLVFMLKKDKIHLPNFSSFQNIFQSKESDFVILKKR